MISRSRTQSSGAGCSAPPSQHSSVCPPGGLALMCHLYLSPAAWPEAPAVKMTKMRDQQVSHQSYIRILTSLSVYWRWGVMHWDRQEGGCPPFSEWEGTDGKGAPWPRLGRGHLSRDNFDVVGGGGGGRTLLVNLEMLMLLSFFMAILTNLHFLKLNFSAEASLNFSIFQLLFAQMIEFN